jgi:hypothetical protein
MRRICSVVASVTMGLAVAASTPVAAQSPGIYYRGGGGLHGGLGRGGIRAGMISGVPRAMGHGVYAPRAVIGPRVGSAAGADWRGTRFGYRSYGGGYPGYGYPAYGYPGYGGYDDGDWALPLGAGIVAPFAAAGAEAGTDAYYPEADAAIGGYCMTPYRTCQLNSPAAIGTGCSCRVPGGRARGSVTN